MISDHVGRGSRVCQTRNLEFFSGLILRTPQVTFKCSASFSNLDCA